MDQSVRLSKRPSKSLRSIKSVSTLGPRNVMSTKLATIWPTWSLMRRLEFKRNMSCNCRSKHSIKARDAAILPMWRNSATISSSRTTSNRKASLICEISPWRVNQILKAWAKLSYLSSKKEIVLAVCFHKRLLTIEWNRLLRSDKRSMSGNCTVAQVADSVILRKICMLKGWAPIYQVPVSPP